MTRGGLAALALLLPACSGGTPVAAPATTPPAAAPTTTPPAPATPPPATPAPASPSPATVTPSPRPPARHGYVFPVAGCRATYGRAHHDYPATDIFAATGCAFVAPVAGRVDEVSRTDEWDGATNRGADRGGLFVSLVGDDGVRYYGSHLSAVARGVAPGVRVRAGARLGSVGTTGSARGTPPHLHFGISWPSRPGVWWVRRGWVRPAPYLDSWRAGTGRSPAAEVAAARAKAGSEAPSCQAYCA